jgi:hypothetical protein
MFGEILGGVLGSVGGSLLQRRSDKRVMRMQQESIQKALGFLDQGETRASEFLRQALSVVEQGRQAALSQTAQQEFQGYRALQDALGQGTSRVMQQSVGRGLFGSSSSGALQRGLIGDYARGVGQLGAQIGGVRAQIEQGFAGQGAAGLGNMANLSSGMAQSRAGIQGGIQFQGPQGLAESYGTLGTALGGAFDAWGEWSKKRKAEQKARLT